MTHRAGLTYADFVSGSFAETYAAALGRQIDGQWTPDEWLARLGGLPLVDQPGRNFHYGHSTDLLGFLLARIEDAPLPDVLAGRLCRPLGMVDTGFTVAADRSDRRADDHGFDDDGGLTVLEETLDGHALTTRPPETTFCSGGQGLWSTVDDFVTFARTFVEGGTVDGIRVLRPETLALMTSKARAGDRVWRVRGHHAVPGIGDGDAGLRVHLGASTRTLDWRVPPRYSPRRCDRRRRWPHPP